MRRSPFDDSEVFFVGTVVGVNVGKIAVVGGAVGTIVIDVGAKLGLVVGTVLGDKEGASDVNTLGD